MKKISREIVYELPVHDSSFLGMEILQKDNGETDLCLNIAFCDGEFDDLTEYSTVISREGNASFLFANCEWIHINTVCNRSQRDSIDYFEFKVDSPELDKYSSSKGKEHVEVVFVSGSKLECIVDYIELVQSRLD